MGNDTYLVITMYHEEEKFLSPIALIISDDDVPDCIADYWRDPDNYKYLYDRLPSRIKRIGPIVDVQRLFDICESVSK